jgi:hypothetical protein
MARALRRGGGGRQAPRGGGAGAADMSAPRLKLQVWSEHFRRWKTAHVLITMLHENLIHMKAHGLKVRVGSQCK